MALIKDFEDNEPEVAKEWSKILDRQFAVFKEGEEYNYVKDLKHAYKNSLRVPLAEQIMKTIPDHAFWDIKKPLQKDIYENERMKINQFGPLRPYPFDNFFQERDFLEYRWRMTKKDNIRDAVSTYRRY